MRHCVFVSLLLLAAAVAQERTRSLTGRVVDESGKALQGVAVCLIEKDAPFVTKELKQQPLTTTAADGTYRADVSEKLGAGCSLLFVGRGRVHVSTPLDPHDAWPVVLPRAHTLVGTVVDQDGEPVAGARVEARDWLWQARYRAEVAGMPWLPTPRTAVRTNARGQFVIPGTVSSGVQLIIGDAFHRSLPVALGNPIKLVMPPADTIHEDSTRRPRWRRSRSFRKRKKEPRGDARVLAGTTGLKTLPVHGLSVRLVANAKRGGAGLAIGGGVTSEVAEYFDAVPVAADGSFSIAAAPGKHLVQVVLPRPLVQGAPDVVDVMRTEIAEGQKTLALDLGKHMPLTIRGNVRSFVPAARLLVGASVDHVSRGSRYAYARYECALSPVTRDGSFQVQAVPGDCTVFVIDLLTGMLLHREPGATYVSSDQPVLELDVSAGACDVQLNGDVWLLSWLEMIVPEELLPKGLDRMNLIPHQYTKRIGCIVPPATEAVRLYLPPCDFDLWFVPDDRGDLRIEHGEAACEIVANEVRKLTVDVPKRKK